MTLKKFFLQLSVIVFTFKGDWREKGENQKIQIM